MELRKNMEEYFPTESMVSRVSHAWIQNLLTTQPDPALSGLPNEQLIDIRENSSLKEKFENQPLANFWAALVESFAERGIANTRSRRICTGLLQRVVAAAAASPAVLFRQSIASFHMAGFA